MAIYFDKTTIKTGSSGQPIVKYDEGYNDGYNQGYTEGYDMGYENAGGGKSILFIEQELTEAQKLQAKDNIDAETLGTAAELLNRNTAVNTANTDYGTVMSRGIYAGTEDMIEGETPLASGVIYLVYKEV